MDSVHCCVDRWAPRRGSVFIRVRPPTTSGEHRGPFSGLTGPRAVVWWLGDGDEPAAAALKLRERGERKGVGAVRTGGGVSLL
jgi:hypothetical protein